MSHVVSLEIEIRDLECLKAACETLGLEFREGQQTWRWYGRWVNDYHAPDAAYHHGISPEDYGKCVHAIGVKGNPAAYEVGVIRDPQGKGYRLVYDFYAGGYWMEAAAGERCGKLVQAYAVQVATKQARRQGLRVQQSVGADGRILLRCSR